MQFRVIIALVSLVTVFVSAVPVPHYAMLPKDVVLKRQPIANPDPSCRTGCYKREPEPAPEPVADPSCRNGCYKREPEPAPEPVAEPCRTGCYKRSEDVPEDTTTD